MTVETTSRKTKQVMTGSVVNYSFSFRAIVGFPEYIKCIRTITATSTDQTMTRVSEIPAPSTASDVLSYVVSISSDGVGGVVTVAWPSTDCTITIYREIADVQNSDYEDFNQFPADTIESDFDKRVMKSQEQQEDIDRSLKYAITAPTGSSLPTGEADKYLGWDSSGLLLVNKTLPTGTLVQATADQAIAHTDNSAYITPYSLYAGARTMGDIAILTTATIAAAVVTTLTATTFTMSGASITPIISKTLTIENPTGSENITFFFADDAITVEKITAILTGTTPSVAWGFKHATSRNGAGTVIVTGTTTDITSGATVTTFEDATIPADSHIWLYTTATSGTINTISFTMQYTRNP